MKYILILSIFLISCTKQPLQQPHRCNWVDCDYKSMVVLKSLIRSPNDYPWTVMFEKLHWEHPYMEYDSIEIRISEFYNLNECKSY